MGLQSYKPYSRIITIISGLIIVIASLDATQVISLFPEYASQINSILVLAGLIAPAISQELRVGRAEELIKEEYTEAPIQEGINVTVSLDGEEILNNKQEEMEDESDIA